MKELFRFFKKVEYKEEEMSNIICELPNQERELPSFYSFHKFI
jgi:hypothetical protein